MIGERGQSGAECRQKTTGDDCRESIFHSARSVSVTMASERKPIFCNKENKLLSFSLCFWVNTTPTPSLSQAFIMKSFVHVRAANCYFCDVTQTEHKSKHWSIVGCRQRFGDHQILCAGQEERQLSHKLTCVCVSLWWLIKMTKHSLSIILAKAYK